MSRSESLRRLAAQLSSLATLEDAVAHVVQVLLEVPQEPAVPIPAAWPASRTALLRPHSLSRAPLSKASPSRPCGSILPSQHDPTGLSCGPARSLGFLPQPPLLLGLCCWPCRVTGVRLVWPEAPHRPSRAPQLLTQVRRSKASQRRASGAAEARQRRRDKHRHRVRRYTKRSMWREI